MYRTVYRTRSCNTKEKVNYMAWTSEMDQCLSKILVDQVKQGNKTDNTFKPAAYTAALTVLNEKFKLDLTKDHIRNRLKTWKKQFGILKELLSHKGFEWDEENKMIVADNSVWNDYIKAHPDARAFRARFIENYDEFCIIIGNDQAIAGHSDNLAETDMSLTVNKEAMDTANTPEVQSDDRQKKNLRWTDEMDSYLGNILVEKVRKGYTIYYILQCDAYDSVLPQLNEKFGPHLTKDHIRSRLRTWKKQHWIVKGLLSHTGFQWDKTQKMILANDSVWNDYIKANPDAGIFRSRLIENYDQWHTIFSGYNEAAEAVEASPIRRSGKVKDQVKNMMWTNEMDCCLSKVLVDQVKLGNKSKSDNKLKPAAYVAAVSALNERFKLDLTKEHVRNRLRTWKKQYEILKELLDQSDFEWDEKQEMVIASDSTWNRYIRRNPDARLLQGRAIKNYDELCVILGYDYPPESSLNGVDTNFDLTADNETVEAEDMFYNGSDYAKEKGKYIAWTDEMDRCLTEQLLEQVMLGNKLEKSFKSVALTAALAVLNDKFALDLTKENIRNRLKTLKKQYALVKELLSHDGFGWDERKNMIIASDSKWNEYIKRNPKARQLRAQSIENYNELRILVGDEQASGHWSEVGTRVVSPPQDKEGLMETPIKMWVDQEMSHDDGIQDSSQKTRARPSSLSHSKQALKRRRSSDVMLEMMSVMAAHISRIAAALTESNKSVCLDELFEMVQAIPGFDDDLIIEACEYLSFDEKRARMFMKLDDRLRKLWLLKRLRG